MLYMGHEREARAGGSVAAATQPLSKTVFSSWKRIFAVDGAQQTSLRV